MALKPDQEQKPARGLNQRLNELLDKLSRWLKAAVSLEQPLSPDDVDAIVLEERVLYSGTPMPVDLQESGGEANVNPDGMGTPIPDDIWAYIESLNPSGGSLVGSVQQQDELAAESAVVSLIPEELAAEDIEATDGGSLPAHDSGEVFEAGSLDGSSPQLIDGSSPPADAVSDAESILAQALALQVEVSSIDALSRNDGDAPQNTAVSTTDEPASGTESTAEESEGDVFGYVAPTAFLNQQPNLIEPYQILGELASDLDLLSNLVGDESWDECPAAPLLPGYDSYLAGEHVGGWYVQRGAVDLLGAELLHSPLAGRCLDFGGVRDFNSISREVATEVGATYQLTYSVTGNWLMGDSTNALVVSADGISEEIVLTADPSESALVNDWSTRTLTFVATKDHTILRFSTTGYDVRGAIVSDVSLIQVPEYLERSLSANPELGFDANRLMFFQRGTQDSSEEPSAVEASESPPLPDLWSDAVTSFVNSDVNNTESPREVVFVQDNLVDVQVLIADLRNQDAFLRGSVEVVVLQSGTDGLTQIADYLRSESNIASIQIVSHGGEGVLRLGDSYLSAENLAVY